MPESRLLINVETGGDRVENRGDGIFQSRSESYQVTKKFVEVYSRQLQVENVDYVIPVASTGQSP